MSEQPIEQPVDVDASDVNIEEWNTLRPPFTPDVTDDDLSPGDVKDWNEDADA